MGSCIFMHPPKRSAKILVIYEAMAIYFMVIVKIWIFKDFWLMLKIYHFQLRLKTADPSCHIEESDCLPETPTEVLTLG